MTGIINNVHNKGQKTILRILSARTVDGVVDGGMDGGVDYDAVGIVSIRDSQSQF